MKSITKSKDLAIQYSWFRRIDHISILWCVGHIIKPYLSFSSVEVISSCKLL